jgi:hypothetical protein
MPAAAAGCTSAAAGGAPRDARGADPSIWSTWPAAEASLAAPAAAGSKDEACGGPCRMGWSPMVMLELPLLNEAPEKAAARLLMYA